MASINTKRFDWCIQDFSFLWTGSVFWHLAKAFCWGWVCPGWIFRQLICINCTFMRDLRFSAFLKAEKKTFQDFQRNPKCSCLTNFYWLFLTIWVVCLYSKTSVILKWCQYNKKNNCNKLGLELIWMLGTEGLMQWMLVYLLSDGHPLFCL